MKVLQPPGWPRPKGYSNGISAQGRMIFTACIVGWDEHESFPEYTLHGQFAQALRFTSSSGTPVVTLIAMVALLLAPGVAIVAVAALVVLAICVVSFVFARWRSRR